MFRVRLGLGLGLRFRVRVRVPNSTFISRNHTKKGMPPAVQFQKKSGDITDLRGQTIV